MTRIFPGLDSRLLGLLLSQRQNAPCIIWHHAHRTSAEHSDTFYQLIYAITCHQQVVLLTAEQRFSPLLPYQFIYREGLWYLIAEYHRQVQVILLDEIRQVQLLPITFKPRDDIFRLSHQNSFIAALPHFRLFSQLMVPLSQSLS
ncbi:putative DNA-binding transcriptional regulator YafY [Providencia alcalifaciens]|nr:putative DNA-binding transcriptional regulator YafY [Providencia alcalifaciens]